MNTIRFSDRRAAPEFPTRHRVIRRTLAMMLAAALGVTPALAQDAEYPSRPVTIVVPFAPGGSLDVTARILGERMRDILGQPVLVVNRPGAGSSVGARSVGAAAPDGYNLFLTSGSAFGFLHLLVKGFSLQLSDFAPIAGLATNTSLFAVSAKFPAKTLQELVEIAQSKPGSVNFCTTGVSGLNHLQLEMFKSQVKAGGKALDVTHVPYNGVAPALTALRGGDEVQACALPYSGLIKNLDGNDIRVLAVQRSKRLASMPHVPTTGESGFRGLDGNDALVNLSAPKATPPAVLRKLESAVRTAMADPVIMRRLEEIDVQPVFVGASETQKWLEEDVRKFSTIIREAGLVAEQ